MNDTSLCDFIRNTLSIDLGIYEDFDICDDLDNIAEGLANDLKNSGYCTDPYFEYDKALMCPINKKREKYCNLTQCTSHRFCEMLRKEGYV
jgi:hypothetical protein